MRSIIRTTIIAFMAVVYAVQASPVNAAQTVGIQKDELGIRRMAVVYPMPGSTISDMQPMITIDFSALETQVDIASVIITFDGFGVSEESEINPVYAVYKPEGKLVPGKHEVRVTAKNVNHEDIEPLAWLFTVVDTTGKADAGADRTTGRLLVSTDYISADYAKMQNYDIAERFREKEGMKTNADLSFTNSSDGRTLSGTYHRETQTYSDMEIDKFRIQYIDTKFRADAGHFWAQWTDLSLLGGEIEGVQVSKNIGSNRFQIISGRTQDPSTSNGDRQFTSGIRSESTIGKHTLGLIGLVSSNNPGASSADASTRQKLLSVQDEYAITDFMIARVELAKSIDGQIGANTTRNDAMRMQFVTLTEIYSAEAEYYRMDTGFLPISEGSSKFLKSNRKGYRVKGDWRALAWINAGAEYEDYDTLSNDQRSKRSQYYMTLKKNGKSLTARNSRLEVSSGTTSKTTGITADYVIKPVGPFGASRLSAGWMNIDFSSLNINSKTDNFQFALRGTYGRRLLFSLSSSHGDSEESMTAAVTESASKNGSLTWHAIPGKLSLSVKYDAVTSESTGVDRKETTGKAGMKYTIDDTTSVTLDCERISSRDEVTPVYNYTQKIIRSGMERSF